MASLQDIRRRIRSVRNTRKITKAIELVAAARLRRAQTRIEEMRPYADRMQELMVGHGARGVVVPKPAAHAAARGPEGRRSSRSAATAACRAPFNGQVLRRAFAARARGARRRPRDRLGGRRPQGRVDAALPPLRARRALGRDSPTSPTYPDAQAVAHKLAEMYTAEAVDRVVVVYNRVRLAARPDGDREPTCCRSRSTCSRAGRRTRTRRRRQCAATSSTSRSRRTSSQRLLPVYLETEIYRALLESAASFLGVADDRDAERVEERERADRPLHARR